MKYLQENQMWKARLIVAKTKVAKTELVIPDEVVSRQKAGRLERAALAKVEDAHKMKVTNERTYIEGADFCLALKETEDAISELYDEPTSKAYELHKSLTRARKKLLEPLQEARRIVQAKMGAWDLAEREKARLKAQEEAEEARRLAIQEAKEEGDKALAKELAAAPVIAAPVGAPAPKVGGVVTQEVWNFRIVDERLIPRQFLIVDERAVKEFVKARGADAHIPGVEVFKEIKTFMRG